jgi:L-rhamnose mutarotase
MERVLMYIRIFPGTEADYDKKHAEIWPDLVAEIQESGIHNFTGFRRGTDVWYYGECHPDVATAFGVHGPKPANTRWNHFFRGIIAEIADEHGNLLRYDEIFHTDGPPLDGPMTRGCFSLVVDPERVADYDALHANPWPDMLAAIEDSGFRNYGGFRRGSHVVYYGEFYPDMATVFARIGQTEVNGRWGKAFEGIILTITDPDGNLLVANEMHHND